MAGRRRSGAKARLPAAPPSSSASSSSSAPSAKTSAPDAHRSASPDGKSATGARSNSSISPPAPTFPFLRLPLELRQKVYQHVFATVALPDVLDLDPSTFDALRSSRALALFAVSRQIHAEATRLFFGSNTFRLFPIHPGRHFKTKRPLLARFSPRTRALLTQLELRLGPGWADPPRGWIVNPALGLRQCTAVRHLRILIECDPSDAIFKGFRRGDDGFYEQFCARLLDDILVAIPGIQIVHFEAWSSVKRDGAMVRTLERVVAAHGRRAGGLAALPLGSGLPRVLGVEDAAMSTVAVYA